MVQAIVTRDRSPLASSSPRVLIWHQPITRLMIPNTGFTACLRSPYSARPSFVLSRCAIHAVIDGAAIAVLAQLEQHLHFLAQLGLDLVGMFPGQGPVPAGVGRDLG